MNWALLIGGLGALYGFALYVIAPDREFKQNLTQTEKRAIAQGQTITKVHKGSPYVFGGKSHKTGLLRVKPGEKGKPVFEPYGVWKQVDKHGILRSDWTYTGVGNEVIERVYFPDGSLDGLLYTVPVLLEGDSVRDTRYIYFVIGQPTDTLVVNHNYHKGGKAVKQTSWSYDAQGRRPVPDGWKFSRY